MATINDFAKARQRAVALGYHSVTAFLSARLGLPPEHRDVTGFRDRLSKGLKTRRLMIAGANLFGVPVTFWLETGPDAIRAAINGPPPQGMAPPHEEAKETVR